MHVCWSCGKLRRAAVGKTTVKKYWIAMRNSERVEEKKLIQNRFSYILCLYMVAEA